MSQIQLSKTPSATVPVAPPKAVLFDWDNTLIDSWVIIHDAMNTTLTHFNMECWTLDETRTRVKQSMRDRFPVLFGDAWSEAAGVFYARYREIHMSQLVPLPGSEEMLQTLHEQRVFLAVVSNKTGEYLRLEAEHLGWDRFFTNLVGSKDAPRDKPAADPVHMALSGSGFEPGNDIWFVGDADIDLECAINTGCLPILVRKTPPAPKEFDEHPPERYLEDCWALKEFTDLCFE